MNDATTAEQAATQPVAPGWARATLVLHQGDRPVVAPLAPNAAVTVGRQFPADLLVDDASVSRQHARFRYVDGEIHVEDLGSRNGTLVRGKPIDRAVVAAGEPLQLGSVTALVHVMAPDVQVPSESPASGPIVRDPRMRELYERVDQVARTTVPVLILGETGTGKELVARALHERSDRAGRPMRVINCAAIPDGLAESLLFGHERGAFTGAHASTQGLFEQADGGTLFLDEIGELSLANQAALLRTLETRTVQPVGSRRNVEVDVRVVAATHRDLPRRVAEGRFREDLFYRINTMTLRLPPLRERSAEIELLAQRFLSEAAHDWSRPLRPLSPAVLERLRRHAWPGNIRQLRNAMEHAVLVARDAEIGLGDLPVEVTEVPRERAETGPAPVPPLSGPTVPPAASTNDGGEQSFKDRVREFEVQMIVDGLRKNDGNQRATARMLGIPVRTLAHKMKAYEIRERLSEDEG